jgi:excisionase family DNA binding protein
VEEAAEEVQRSPSTVRSWLWAGTMRGYKLNGRNWRIPRSALREYLDSQGRKAATVARVEVEEDGKVDLSAWRKVRRPD